MVLNQWSNSHQFDLQATVENIQIVCERIRRFMDSTNANEVACHSAELCLSEAFTNCILHAYDSRNEGWVRIELYYTGIDYVLKVNDQGKKMPIEHLEKAKKLAQTQKHLPMQSKEHGRGLIIICMMMERVLYETIGEINSLTMHVSKMILESGMNPDNHEEEEALK
jgi:anti-sigma regulatory factor (Ser/Thr protein kinase)